MPDKLPDYRGRIYQRYLTLAEESCEGITPSDLRPRMPYYYQMIKKHFPRERSAKILEIGCGCGALLYALQQRGYHDTSGVDGSSEQVLAARALGVKGVSESDVMEALSSCHTSSQDVVVAFDLIEHLTKPEFVALVDEVYRVLKPEGRWIIHTVNAESLFGARGRYSDFTHELAFTAASLRQLLKASGFAAVSCFEDRPVAHGVKSAIRAILWSAIRAILLFYMAVETGSTDRSVVFSQNFLVVASKS